MVSQSLSLFVMLQRVAPCFSVYRYTTPFLCLCCSEIQCCSNCDKVTVPFCYVAVWCTMMHRVARCSSWQSRCSFWNNFHGNSDQDLDILKATFSEWFNTCVSSCLKVKLERMRILCGIKFTKHSIKFVFVETNELVRSNSNAILTRQNLRPAGSKGRALQIYFSVQSWHMFLMAKCRRKWDQKSGLCTTPGLAKTVPLRSADSDLRRIWLGDHTRFKIGSNHILRSCILFASTGSVHRPDLTVLYILTLGT